MKLSAVRFDILWWLCLVLTAISVYVIDIERRLTLGLVLVALPALCFLALALLVQRGSSPSAAVSSEASATPPPSVQLDDSLSHGVYTVVHAQHVQVEEPPADENPWAQSVLLTARLSSYAAKMDEESEEMRRSMLHWMRATQRKHSSRRDVLKEAADLASLLRGKGMAVRVSEFNDIAICESADTLEWKHVGHLSVPEASDYASHSTTLPN